jgi:hypothetical protein
MKNIKLSTIALACSLFAGSASAELKAQWDENIQFTKATIINKKIESPQVNLSKDPINFSYKLGSSELLDFSQKPYIESSKQYWLDTNGTKLAQGVDLPVTGGEAIIRISPLTNDKLVQLTAAQIEVFNNGVASSINVFADSQQLKATGAPFSDNSIALKINPTAGRVQLKVANTTEKTPFVIHVLEPNSSYELSLSSAKSTYAANQSIHINTQFDFEKTAIDTTLQGYVNRPDGSIAGELKFIKNNDGSYTANLNNDSTQGLSQGLWEAHVFAKSTNNGIEIMRDAQTSFAVNLNTARIDGQLKMHSNKLELGVEVGVKGRYELRGVVFGTDSKGELKPLSMTMSAQWLEQGTQSLSLDIDQKILSESGLKAPFAIRNIQLSNQTYMAPVQQLPSGINLIDSIGVDNLNLK